MESCTTSHFARPLDPLPALLRSLGLRGRTMGGHTIGNSLPTKPAERREHNRTILTSMHATEQKRSVHPGNGKFFHNLSYGIEVVDDLDSHEVGYGSLVPQNYNPQMLKPEE